MSERDDSYHGCYRPAIIWSTSGWFNNGSGGHFEYTPENEAKAVKMAISFMKSYNKEKLENAQKRLADNNFEADTEGLSKKECEKIIKYCENEVERVSNLVTMNKKSRV